MKLRMMRSNQIVSLVLLALFCGLLGGSRVMAQVGGNSDKVGQPSAQSITIGAGDLLEISVFDAPELSLKARVSESGDLALPLIGTVHVAGLSIDGTQKLLAQRLRDGQFIREPQVSILVDEYATQGITILGEVSKPGIYPAIGGKQLYDLISLSGGLTPTAGSVATISHRGQSGDATEVRFRNATGDLSSNNIMLVPGDTVVVGRAGIVYVLGEVNRPGGFVMNREQISVLEALALAQGEDKIASLNHTRLIRHTDAGIQQTILPLKQILSAKQPDVLLKNGDIIYVPSNVFKDAMQMGMQSVITSAISASIYYSIMK